MRRAIGAARKLPPDKLFHLDSFERSSLPPPNLLPLIEAARAAPSADNAQPWRFLWREDRLTLYLKRKSLRYELGGTQDYRWYDGGLCMANVSLAMEALGVEGAWSLIDAQHDVVPTCPNELEPLAVLRMG
jgi:nitroreductase